MASWIGSGTGTAEPVPPLESSGPDDEYYRDVEQLFVELRSVTDEEERRRRRGEIITRCLPLAEHIANRYRNRGQPHDDLTQVARVGLVNAVNRYQPDKGPFLAFAVPTILGEVRRYFRDNTWGMKVSRGVKDSHGEVRATIEPLSQRLGRAPTASELAGELGMDREKVVACLAADYAYQPRSFYATTSSACDADTIVLDTLGADDLGYSAVEDSLVVAGLIDQLCERQRALLRMRFGECMSQKQIAERLGISQMHVSRLLAATLARLRARLLDDPPQPKAADFAPCTVPVGR